MRIFDFLLVFIFRSLGSLVSFILNIVLTTVVGLFLVIPITCLLWSDVTSLVGGYLKIKPVGEVKTENLINHRAVTDVKFYDTNNH